MVESSNTAAVGVDFESEEVAEPFGRRLTRRDCQLYSRRPPENSMPPRSLNEITAAIIHFKSCCK